MLKRAFDMVAAVFGLMLLSPLLLAAAAVVKLSSPGPVLFRQERIGRAFQPFFICKFRSMLHDAPQRGGPITFGDDCRITRVGRWLRKSKVDELPQLFNVLRGDMSFVGPRPEVRKYVELFRDDFAEILRVRPGITDLASLQYRDEAALLGQAENPAEEYALRILPAKIALAKQYVANASFLLDVSIILKTLIGLFHERA